MGTTLNEERTRTHLLLFEDPHHTLTAVKRLREAGFTIDEVYSPFPVHGLDEAMGVPDTRLPWATLIGGFIGGTLGLTFQLWTHTIGFPLNIGGKTNAAGPGTIPVTFELTVLFAAFATVFTFIFRNRLFGPKQAKPDKLPDPRVTDDRFAVLVLENNASFSWDRFSKLCQELEPSECLEGWRVR